MSGQHAEQAGQHAEQDQSVVQEVPATRQEHGRDPSEVPEVPATEQEHGRDPSEVPEVPATEQEHGQDPSEVPEAPAPANAPATEQEQLPEVKFELQPVAHSAGVTKQDSDFESSESGSESESESGSESGSDSDTPTTDYNADTVHEDVEDLLAGTNEEILELIATDPAYYFGLVENYKHMRDGREIYLPDLFNLLINRHNGQLRSVKFKLSDNTQWYEIGYTAGEFNDETIYKAFTEKVNALIRNPPPTTRREFLDDIMKPEPKAAPVMVNQGNQNTLTKIDRFLGRTQHAMEDPPMSQGLSDQTAARSSRLSPRPSPNPGLATAQAAPKEDMLGLMVQSYKEQLQKRLQLLLGSSSTDATRRLKAAGTEESSLASQLNLLKSHCPESKQNEYKSVVGLLNSTSPFITGLVETLTLATPGQQVLLINFLKSNATHSSKSELAALLELSSTDLQLLEQYNIDLTQLVD